MLSMHFKKKRKDPSRAERREKWRKMMRVPQVPEAPSHHPGVPMFIAPVEPPGCGGLPADDVSLADISTMSELTLDQSLLTPAPANSNGSGRSENEEAQCLEKIGEDLGSNEVSNSYAPQDHHDNENMSVAQSLSNSSANHRQVGAVPVKRGDRILDRKLRGDNASNALGPNHNSCNSVNRNSGNSVGRNSLKSMQAVGAEAGLAQFDDEENAMTARGAQATRKGDRWVELLEALIEVKKSANDANARSNSSSHVERSQSSGDAVSIGSNVDIRLANYEDDRTRKTNEEHGVPKRSISSEEAMERYNDCALEKTLTGTAKHRGSWDAGSGDGKMNSDADHSNENAMTPGAHRVKDDGQYATVLDRKLAAGKDKKTHKNTHGEGSNGDGDYITLMDRKLHRNDPNYKSDAKYTKVLGTKLREDQEKIRLEGSLNASSGDGKLKSDVDHSNENGMTPGAHRVNEGKDGQYVTIMDRKMAAAGQQKKTPKKTHSEGSKSDSEYITIMDRKLRENDPNYKSNAEYSKDLGKNTGEDQEKICRKSMPDPEAQELMTSFAIDPAVLSEIREKGIISEFERLLEEDSRMSTRLRVLIQDLLNLAEDGKDTGRGLVFQESFDEDETCHCIRANLRAITSPDFAPNRTSHLRSNVLRAMRRFPTSSDVHEDGCKLLACVFALAPEDSESIPSTEILPDVLETMMLSLKDHKNIAKTAAAACSALQNFCAMMSARSDPSVDAGDGLNDLLVRSMTEVTNAIVIYHQDEPNMERATGALQAICAMREGLAMSFESDITIELVLSAMNAFPDNANLQRQGIGILGLFFFMSEKFLGFLTDAFIATILRFIEKEVDNDDCAALIDTAINILLVIANRGFQGVTVLLRSEKLADAVVSCMFKYPDCPSVQGAGTDILSNISLDNYIRADVCQRGGTSRILCALKNLKHDPLLACKAFAALANLTSGSDDEILRAPEAPAPATMVQAMLAHPDDLAVQLGGAYAIWALSARSDSFKHEIVSTGGAEAIADAMAHFVACKHMQGKGFVVIWSLAVPRPLKARVGQRAVGPVVNGLVAHISSEKVCEEALGCIKCLSTIPANKDRLEELGVVDAIYTCMWLHSDKPAICKAALATLCYISINAETNEVSEIMAVDLDAVVSAMRAHQTVKCVQESAITLLRNFTFWKGNVAILEANHYVVPLVRSAMSTFNDHFQGRAEDLLRVLPPIQQ